MTRLPALRETEGKSAYAADLKYGSHPFFYPLRRAAVRWLSSRLWVEMGIKLLKVSANLTCRALFRLRGSRPSKQANANKLKQIH